MAAMLAAAWLGVLAGGTANAQSCDPVKVGADDGESDDDLGRGVAIDGDTMVLGAPHDFNQNGDWSGAALVFTRTNGVWTQLAELLANDAEEHDNFGNSVSVSGDTMVVGSSNNLGRGNRSGAAYVFTRTAGEWTQQTKFLPTNGPNGSDLANFGASVSVSGDATVIGAPNDKNNGRDAGKVTVYWRTGEVWNQRAELYPADGTPDDRFGFSVAINNDTIVAGSPFDFRNERTGSAYLFKKVDGVWTESAKLLPPEGEAAYRFGERVTIHGDTAVFGVPRDETNGSFNGAAYVFDLNCTDCPPDLNGDGVVNTQDFLAYLGAWSAGDLLADWNGDSEVNTLDFVAYLNDWVAGC